MKFHPKSAIFSLVVGLALLTQGCGGSGGGSTTQTGGSAPTSQTKASVAQNLGAIGVGLVTNSFTAFSAALPISSGPTYDSRLGLWVVTTLSSTSLTRTFYVEQAETEPAGSAIYTLDVATETLSGSINITAGKYSGLNGTYSATKNGSTISGTESFTLPNGTSVASQFNVTVSGASTSGSIKETITLSSGYSETATVTRNSNGTFKIAAMDSNGYSATLNFNADYSGTGTVNGPFPGLPATVTWNSVGTGSVTFANGLTVDFTNWQFPKAP